MSEGMVMMLIRDFLHVTLTVAAPLLLVSLTVGLAISLVQVLTSVQDMTLTYVVRLATVVIMLGLVGRWMLHGIAAYTARLWQGIPGFVG